jgi:hypothetical protein
MSMHRLSRCFRSIAASAALLLLGSGVAHAANPCVATSDDLQTALSSATNKATPYEIHLVASATPYQLGPGNNFVYLPNYTTIKGGYTQGCAAQSDDAGSTIIDLGGYGIGFFPNDNDNTSKFEFDSLTIRHGNFFARTGYVGVFSDEIGYIIIHDTRFTNLANDQEIAPVSFNAIKGALQMVNVQFDHLSQTSADSCAVHVSGENDSTFTANFITADLSNGKDFCLDASSEGGTFNARIDNSIIWGSDNASPDTSTIRGMDSSGHGHPLNLAMHYDHSHAFIGYGTLTTTYQMSGDPHWMNPAAGDYRLADIGSPAVNTGSATGGLGVPYYDINFGLRTVGSHPDRGAHESPFDDAPTLLVKNTNDDGVDSLRAAVTNANQYGGTHTIAFQLGACPSVIYLAAPLPALTSAVIVDGYTQAGSAPNDNDDVFDATLCVLIKPATSATSAFRVASNANGGGAASLTLRGVGLGGFGQDVILLGGANHLIVGNQFGGVANGVNLGTSSLSDITLGVDADSFAIGSFGPANRNLMGGSTVGNGISIQSGVVSDPDHCQVVNNWIGLAPDGLTAAPNEFGVNLSGSGCAVVGNRIAGNSIHNLWINGGNNNVVQQNLIGYNDWANGLPNNGIGILISGDNNTIGGGAMGSAPGSLLANYVGKMSGGGIVVAGGQGNSIRGNFITDNGPNQDGAGMDIDLNGDGPTPNGAALPGGPNNFQYFAVVDSVLFRDYPPVGNVNSSAVLAGHLNAVPDTYKIDVYFSTFCSAATGRGHAGNYLGDFTVTIPAGGTQAAFTIPITLPSDIGFNGLSLTATSATNGTSEIGTCFPISSAVNDAIFKSGLGTGAEY